MRIIGRQWGHVHVKSTREDRKKSGRRCIVCKEVEVDRGTNTCEPCKEAKLKARLKAARPLCPSED